MENIPQHSHQLIRLTQAQAGNKMDEVQQIEDALYEWVK